MKKLLLSCLLVAGITACVPQQTKDEIAFNAARCDAFIAQIDSGITTRKNEQDFIRANRKAWWAMNHAINDAELPADLKPKDGN